MDFNLVAPCGINCGVCRAHLRPKNPCPGCRLGNSCKPKTRLLCKIKTCPRLAANELEFCSGCGKFPCEVLLRLDKRYRAKYGTSPVENLLKIQKTGPSGFIRSEIRKWTCPACGGLLCMHEPRCPSCGYAWRG